MRASALEFSEPHEHPYQQAEPKVSVAAIAGEMCPNVPILCGRNFVQDLRGLLI